MVAPGGGLVGVPAAPVLRPRPRPMMSVMGPHVSDPRGNRFRRRRVHSDPPSRPGRFCTCNTDMLCSGVSSTALPKDAGEDGWVCVSAGVNQPICTFVLFFFNNLNNFITQDRVYGIHPSTS